MLPQRYNHAVGYSFHHKDINILVNKDLMVKDLLSTTRIKTDWQPLPEASYYIPFSFSHTSINKKIKKTGRV